MITFLLVVHIIIAIGLVFFILMQHSEGGASGFVSGQMGNVMSIRGTANFMTKTTSILATLFFLSSIGLAMYSKTASKPKSIADSFSAHVKKEDAKPQVPVAPIAGQTPKTDTSNLDAPKTVAPTAPVNTQPVAPIAPTPVEPKAEASNAQHPSTSTPVMPAAAPEHAAPAAAPTASQSNTEAPKN